MWLVAIRIVVGKGVERKGTCIIQACCWDQLGLSSFGAIGPEGWLNKNSAATGWLVHAQYTVSVD